MNETKIQILTAPFRGGGLPGPGRVVGGVHAEPEGARLEGHQIITTYVKADPMGNMGVFLGVTAVPGGFRAVINTYHSNT